MFPDHRTIEEQPPLQSDFETFDAQPTFSFHLQTGPTSPRIWLRSGDNTDLIQIQSDRFIRNWCKATECTYPRYEKLREQFLHDYKKFLEFTARNNLASPQPNQCEVSYINTIEVPEATNAHHAMERIFTFWKDVPTANAESQFENATVQLRHIITSMPNRARLAISVDPIFRANDLRPFLRFTLSIRGQPAVPLNEESIISFFNESRNLIVQRFAELTTPEMHKLWKRTDAA